MANNNLVSLGGQNVSTGYRSLRSVKMGQPLHAECQTPYRRGWWVQCLALGHTPYETESLRLVETPIYGKDEDGDMVLQETKSKQKLITRPNITQVPLDAGHNDGKGPDRFKREKGFVELEEIGYKPLCQLQNCWKDATLTCDYGEYCSKDHARLVAANADGFALEILDARKRRRQLRSVELDDD